MLQQRVFILEERFYYRPVFTNYAASKEGEIVNVKTQRILKTQKIIRGISSFLYMTKNLKNQKITINTNLFLKQ